MPARPTHLARSLAAAVVAAAFPALAPAQNQVNQGNALDANSQVGSGGYNRAEGQVDYRARNNLITGNVADGRQFRGSVNYVAPGELRTNLGSDDLFQFQAESLSSSLFRIQSGRGGTAGAYNVPSSVYRPFTDLQQTSQQVPTGTIIEIAPRGGAFGSRDIGSGLITSDALLDTAAASSPLRASLFDARGEPLTAGRSGLLDLQYQDPLRVNQELTPFDVDRDLRTPGDRGRVNPLERTPEEDAGEQGDDTPATGLDARIREQADARLDPRLNTRVDGETGEAAARRTDEPLDATLRGGFVDPSIMLGRTLRARIEPRRLGPGRDTLDQQVAQIEQMIFNQRPAAQGQEDEVYRDVLARIANADAEEEEDGDDRGEAGDGRQPWAVDIEDPDEGEVEAAEAQRVKALRRMYGLDESEDDPDARLDDPDGSAEDDPLAGLVNRLDHDLPRLETLAGDREDRLTKLMADAEQKLAEGEYFPAEALYRRVVRERPDRPMARVGLVHAQLSAGMIRSAAFNLRTLFEKHPELIDLRYDKKLLPPASRLAWLQGELTRMLDDDKISAEPGLMMAYLGHQIESRQLIRYGLALAEARKPRDPLFPLLRKLWLDAGDGEQGEAEADRRKPTPAAGSDDADADADADAMK